LKTQVNLGTIQETLLVPLVATTNTQQLPESLTDRKQLKEANTPPYKFVIEGLLMYLSEQQVKQLIDKLIEKIYDSRFAFGCPSPLMIKNQQRHDSIKHMSANFDSVYFGYPQDSESELGLSGDENYYLCKS
jgi:hypothetical protein